MEELIPDDHVCRVIDVSVDRLDMSDWEFERAEAADPNGLATIRVSSTRSVRDSSMALRNPLNRHMRTHLYGGSGGRAGDCSRYPDCIKLLRFNCERRGG